MVIVSGQRNGGVRHLVFRFKIERPELTPVRKTLYSAGYDIFNSEDITLEPFKPRLAATGLWIEECCDNSYHLDIRPRSSLFKSNVFVQYGTIDADYRDEIKVQIIYIPDIIVGPNNEVIRPRSPRIPAGNRIAQLLVSRTENIINGKTEESTRQGGFGSTD